MTPLDPEHGHLWVYTHRRRSTRRGSPGLGSTGRLTLGCPSAGGRGDTPLVPTTGHSVRVLSYPTLEPLSMVHGGRVTRKTKRLASFSRDSGQSFPQNNLRPPHLNFPNTTDRTVCHLRSTPDVT